MNLVPINGNVLIELVEQYEYAATPDKEYATKTSGYARAYKELVSGNQLDKLAQQEYATQIKDKRVWFTSYKDDIKIERDGKTYTFIKFEDITGYEQD